MMISVCKQMLFLLLIMWGSAIQSYSRSVEQLPKEMMGFWFGSDSITAEIYLSPEYFKHRGLDSSLTLLFDYENIVEDQNTYQILGRYRNKEISFSLRLENGRLYYGAEDDGTIVLKQIQIPSIAEISEAFNDVLAPIVGEDFEDVFERRYWRDTAWIYPTINLGWSGSYTDGTHIGREFMYSNGLLWRYKAAVLNDTFAIVILESISQGFHRPILLTNERGKRRKLIDFLGGEVGERELVRTNSYGIAPIHSTFEGTYIRAFSHQHNGLTRFEKIVLGGLHLSEKGRSWNLVGISGPPMRYFYRFGQEIRMLQVQYSLFNQPKWHNAFMSILHITRGLPEVDGFGRRRPPPILTRADLYVPLFYFYILAFIIFILVLPIFLFFRLMKSRQRNQQLQVSVLRSQLNPHFIFNAMNSIQSLVNQKEIGKTNSYLNDFARLLRSVITQTEEELIPISEELETLEQYCRLEALRADFTYTVDVSSDIDIYSNELPPGLLQPIVENAVVHAFINHENPNLKIELLRDERTLWILIVDNGPGIEKEDLYTGKGVYLVRERIKAINKTGMMKIRFKQENLKAPQSGLHSSFKFIKYF